MLDWKDLNKKIFGWPECVCCLQATANTAICDSCHNQLFDFTSAPINLLHQPDICRMVRLPNCDGLSAAAWYKPPLNNWIKGLKFSHSSHYLPALNLISKVLWQTFLEQSVYHPDLISSIPLHRTRLIHRGYNQVEQIWQPLAHKSPLLVRNKLTKAQAELSRAQRQRNLSTAFTPLCAMSGKRVLLLDDVITTGTTMNTAAQACLEAGATSVWAMALCITRFN
ncbi:ComF family protein [Pseudoalteromonas sp. T1lg65]|uniref:ComF family protein n=1 Tax=Pseudoalteromonas sp. T1lg65 TaxID=2077101 RepID=UPI003F7A5440